MSLPVVRLIGAPTDCHSSYLRGAASGPAAIRAALASDHGNAAAEGGVELGIDIRLDDIGDLPFTDMLSATAADDALLFDAIIDAMTSGSLPLVVGGDHSVSVPVVAALAAAHGPLDILHFDAHPDIYDDYGDDPRSHASPFARIFEAGHAKRLVQIGIRTMNRHCREQAARFGIEVIEMKEFDVAAVPVLDGPLYISIDMDGFDPSAAPGVAHLEPGGLTVREVLAVIGRQTARLAGADIVELHPPRDPTGVTAILAAKLVRELAALYVRNGGCDMINRRQMMAAGGAGLALAALPAWAAAPELASITGAVPRIGSGERAARIAKAQRLMRANGIGAILIEPGSSLDYFTGVQWWRSERLTCAVIPVEGTPCIVTPFFEEPSVRESLNVPAEVRVWQEDESPVALVAAFLKEHGLAKRPVGIEETVRFFVNDGIAGALPDARLVSANPVVRGCRMIKTSSEITLMQAASDVTVRAINHAIARTEVGMTPADITALIVAATTALGGEADGALVLLGEASAYPHGSGKPQRVVKQEIILIDCGCSVGGYQSDISRTFVLGGATAEQRKVFGQVQEGQRIAFAAARLGAPAGSVDDAVRTAYERMGYGPRYKLPGTSHRTGHGIGMDGHEPVNLVHGETTPLARGMCFSNEPGIYAPGKFGVRIEDCFHMTDTGPKWFSEPQRSIEYPAE